MHFKTKISFLTAPNDDIIAGDNITQCEVIALDEVGVGNTWNIQNNIYILYVNDIHNWNAGEYRRNAPVHLYSRPSALHCHQKDI